VAVLEEVGVVVGIEVLPYLLRIMAKIMKPIPNYYAHGNSSLGRRNAREHSNYC
jgi:ABC-type phosphate transport system permease subunit